MTKTLTEQWREGTLPRGAYYVNRLGEVRIYLVTYSEDDKNTHEIYEILAPVPYFNHFSQLVKKVEKLEQQLAIATKALKEYADKDKWHYCSKDIEYFYTIKDGWYDAEQALKEMRGVK